MSHCLHHDVLDFHPRVYRAVTLGAAHALAALLLEHADFRPTRFALDNGNNPGICNKRRAGEHLPPVFSDEEPLAECYFGARLPCRAVERGKPAGRYPHLPSARLNDCVHIFTHPKPRSYSERAVSSYLSRTRVPLIFCVL